MIDRIEIVCDDPRHDGLMGEVATFALYGGEWIRDLPPPRQGEVHYRKRRKSDDEPVRSLRCPLCPPRRPQQLQASGATLQWLLNVIAEQGMSQPTMRVANLLLSNRP